MSRNAVSPWRSRTGLLFGSVLLLTVLAGCTTDSADPAGVGATLREFIASFARSAAAAWLL